MTQKWFLVTLALLLLYVWALPLPVWISSSPNEASENKRIIRQHHEECLKAHDAADFDRIDDADFTVSGDFGIVRRQQLDKVRHRAGHKVELITRKIDSQQSRSYGDVALVTETDRSTSRRRDIRISIHAGQFFPSQLIFTFGAPGSSQETRSLALARNEDQSKLVRPSQALERLGFRGSRKPC